MEKYNFKDKVVHVLLIVFCLCLFYKACNQTYELDSYSRYTVGVITENYRSAYYAKQTRYQFQVNGVLYIKGESYTGGEVGKRYFVKFSCKNPNYSELIDYNPVPDTLKYVPPEGWNKIPKGLEIYKAPNTY